MQPSSVMAYQREHKRKEHSSEELIKDKKGY